MDFSLINSFVAVAEEQSFSTAAKHLFVSQQSLSKQVARLEEELGTTLLVRSRPLRLTPDGKLFLKTAKDMLHLKQQYEERASSNKKNSDEIHVGIEHTIGRAILPHILPVYMERHPDTYVRIYEDSPETLEKAIAYEGIDLVVGSITNPPAVYETVPLCKKEQLLVVPKKILHELAGDKYEEVRKKFSKCADLRYFESCPFIKMYRGASGGRSLNSYTKYYDIRPRYVCELTNVENAFQLANSGLGLFVYAKLFWDMTPAGLQQDYLKNIDIFPLPYLPGTDKVCAYYNRESSQRGNTPELLQLFSDFFKDYEKGYFSPGCRPDGEEKK